MKSGTDLTDRVGIAFVAIMVGVTSMGPIATVSKLATSTPDLKYSLAAQSVLKVAMSSLMAFLWSR